jgi:hypothetical protein
VLRLAELTSALEPKLVVAERLPIAAEVLDASGSREGSLYVH